MVAYVDWTAPKGRQVHCFDIKEKLLPWATENYATGALSFTNGKRNCARIAAAEKRYKFSALALDYCRERGGYLGAYDLLNEMLPNYLIANEAFIKIGAEPIDPVSYYWSSSENQINFNYVWVVSPADNGWGNAIYSKGYIHRVRCIYSY